MMRALLDAEANRTYRTQRYDPAQQPLYLRMITKYYILLSL